MKSLGLLLLFMMLGSLRCLVKRLYSGRCQMDGNKKASSQPWTILSSLLAPHFCKGKFLEVLIGEILIEVQRSIEWKKHKKAEKTFQRRKVSNPSIWEEKKKNTKFQVK